MIFITAFILIWSIISIFTTFIWEHINELGEGIERGTIAWIGFAIISLPMMIYYYSILFISQSRL